MALENKKTGMRFLVSEEDLKTDEGLSALLKEALSAEPLEPKTSESLPQKNVPSNTEQ
jgi:hypothetical protein